MTSDSFSMAGHSVRRIGFGAMQLPGAGVMGPPRDHDEAISVLRRTAELRINHIDTAQFYGPDVANELIHEALHPYADDLVLVSKTGGDRRSGLLPAGGPAGGDARDGRRRSARGIRGQQRVDGGGTERTCRRSGLRAERLHPAPSGRRGHRATVCGPWRRLRAVLPAGLCLPWLLHHSDNILSIPGTSSGQHLEENAAAGSITLSDSDIAELDGAV